MRVEMARLPDNGFGMRNQLINVKNGADNLSERFVIVNGREPIKKKITAYGRPMGHVLREWCATPIDKRSVVEDWLGNQSAPF